MLNLSLASSIPTAIAQLPATRELKAAKIELSSSSELEKVDGFIAGGQWDEAVEAIRRLMETQGTRIMPAERAPRPLAQRYERFSSVRDICHLTLASWLERPEALALYRSRVDPLARRWYDSGVEQRDDKLLQRVADQFFASSVGDDALFRLGEFALERGEYSRARHCWERISPLLRTPVELPGVLRAPSGAPLWLAVRGVDLEQTWSELEPLLTSPPTAADWLAYPDTNLPLADVRARLVLVSILEGSGERAEIELALLQRLHPDAKGTLAGRDGAYVLLLETLLEESRAWASDVAVDWPTFAGSVSRNQHAARDVDVAGAALWSVELAEVQAEDDVIAMDRPRIAETSHGPLSYHPLVAGDLVLWNDADNIWAHKLRSAEPAWPGFAMNDGQPRDPYRIYPVAAVAADANARRPWGRRPHVGVPRYTMTAFGDNLFARMGPPPTASRDDDNVREEAARSYLLGLDLSKQGKLLPGFPIRPDDVRYEFEGAPITDGSRLFVAMRYSGARSNQASLHLACYDLRTVSLPPGKTMRPRWRVQICEADTVAAEKRDEITHVLLTLSEGTLYCNTNLGVVAALDADDGSIRWLTRYQRGTFRPNGATSGDSHFFRDLNPCICYKGLVIAAPSDTDRVFALDAADGRLVWERALDNVVHLLGVGADNLLAAGDSLYWIDVYSGRIVAQFPQPSGQPAAGFARREPAGFGRGILAGSRVIWPTHEHLLVFEQRTLNRQAADGRIISEPHGVRVIDLEPRGTTGGNLVIADGVLLIAGPDRLSAFDEYGPPPTNEQPQP